MPTQNLSVVIVSWNVCELLRGCLASLDRERHQTPDARIDAWVLDNASSDGSPDMVADEYPWVTLARSELNLGYAAGNNQVIKQILAQESPDAIWLLNPDTVIGAGCIRTMLGFLQETPRAGLIGPRLLNVDGTLQESAFRFPGLLQLLFDLQMLPQRFYYSRFNGRYSTQACSGSTPFQVDHPLGAAMMARTAAVRESGLLDEGFFMYCEEIDWAWRMHKQAWTSWMVPSAVVTHYGGASSSQVRPESLARLWASRARLYRRHRPLWVYRVAGILVKRAWRHTEGESQEWRRARQQITEAWST